MNSRAEVAHRIKHLVGTYLHKKRQAVYFEVGLNKRGRLRADVFSLSMKGRITLVEVKSCVADFMNDSKWLKYGAYSHKLYLAMRAQDHEVLAPQIPKHVGVFVIQDDLSLIQKVRPAKQCLLGDGIVFGLAIRAAFRNQDLNNRKNVRFTG